MARSRSQRKRSARTGPLPAQTGGSRPFPDDLSRTLSLLNATLESTADGILVVDLDGNMVSCNRKFREMWDAPESAFGERGSRLAFVQDKVKDPAAFAARVLAIYASPEVESMDVIELNDGRVFERYSKPQRLHGAVVGRVVSFQDVTRQRGAEAALRDALAWQQAVFEGSRDAVLITDADSRFVMVNSAAERLTGFSRDELLTMRIPDLHDEADLEAYRQYHDPIMAGQEHVTEALVRRKDGTKVPVEFNGRRITQGGRPLMHTVARDITERVATAAQLASHVRRKAALAQLGEQALAGHPVQLLLTAVCAAAADLLDAEYTAVLQLQPDGKRLQLVAGAGWPDGLVGTAVGVGRRSLAGYTLLAQEPVIVPDLAGEKRFAVPPHLREHQVRSALSVPIAGRSAPYGALAVFTRRVRRFSEDDANFLSAVANVLAQAVIRRQEEHSLTKLVHRLITAQEDERASLARELHDETGQALTSLLVGLKSLEAAPGPEAAALVRQLREVGARTLENVSRLAQGLRPSVLDDLGLVPALSRYVSEHAAIHRLTAETHVAGLDGARLPAPIEVTLYRIAQEALTNVARHASATRVTVSLEREGNLVRLEVRDDGRGFDLDDPLGAAGAPARLGLYGIRERAALLGGTAEVHAASGRGTTLTVVIPLET
jgi:PAS domain S-box-containing protein